MEHTHRQSNKDTFVNQKIEATNKSSDKTLTLLTSNKKWIALGYLGFGYYITFTIIAPLLKSTFLIASWSNLLLFYGIVVFIGFILSQIFNTLIKLLLYLFKS